jgi:hypothetical protein
MKDGHCGNTSDKSDPQTTHLDCSALRFPYPWLWLRIHVRELSQCHGYTKGISNRYRHFKILSM